MSTRSEASVSSLAAARRRASPPSEEDQLRRILDAHDEIVGAGLDIHRLVDVVTHRAAELTHSAGAVLEVIEGDELVYWSASGSIVPFLGLRVHAERSLSGLAAKSNRVLACDDTETDPRVDREACRRLGVRSMLTAPLPYRGVNIGVLKVVSPWRKAYSGHDVEVLERLNTLIGAALAHATEHALLAERRVVADAVRDDDQTLTRGRIEKTIAIRDFQLAYQPIVDLQRSVLVGHEGLVRFLDVESPTERLDEAHGVGLGEELELCIVEKALQTFFRWDPPTYVAVNLSPSTVLSTALERVCAPFDSSRVVLEITEHRPVEDYGALAERVNVLKRHGFRFAIDDAGAGFSSLRHVLRLRPDFIKLDRSITHAIDSELTHQTLASALLTFAEGTSSVIVAEGIETEAEATTLRQLGVPFGQGYFLGRPAGAQETRTDV